MLNAFSGCTVFKKCAVCVIHEMKSAFTVTHTKKGVHEMKCLLYSPTGFCVSVCKMH